MNTATPFPWSDSPAGENPGTTFRAAFEHAPIAVARCNAQGVIVEMNPAFERALDRGVASRRRLRLCELVRPQDRDKTESLLRDLLDSRRDSIAIEARGAGHGQASAKWTAWRQPGCEGEPDHALLMVDRKNDDRKSDERNSDAVPAQESLLQTQRWEAVGRLAGGVVHDFNNLLTGVMLYCDLLLSSLDARDRRRRYADEIRSAIVQATGLVRQLLVFARPQATPARLLCLNDVAAAMRDLLTRLIGENIALNLHFDPELGAVKIDRAQAQQIILNLVLNARDALPDGGRITVETSNCKFQPLSMTAASGLPAFPCVLLVVGDDGHGMNAETRQRLFEPFFTTKNAGQGTGLGLTTVRSIVTTNRGLIHFESEPGRGTRVMILLPRAFQPAESDLLDPASPDIGPASATPSQEIKKESLL
jgi:two-component system, cell cycle sensor histidine kinase and response regulator CckA